jgi:DNA-binding response OmpR family regulator
MCRLVATSLRRSGYDVTMCTNGINLLDHLGSYLLRGGEDHYALIVSDIRMPGVTGMEVLEGLRHVKAAPPVILITAFGDRETHLEAERFGAVAVLDKPFELDRLLRLVESVLSKPNGSDIS